MLFCTPREIPCLNEKVIFAGWYDETSSAITALTADEKIFQTNENAKYTYAINPTHDRFSLPINTKLDGLPNGVYELDLRLRVKNTLNVTVSFADCRVWGWQGDTYASSDTNITWENDDSGVFLHNRDMRYTLRLSLRLILNGNYFDFKCTADRYADPFDAYKGQNIFKTLQYPISRRDGTSL